MNVTLENVKAVAERLRQRRAAGRAASGEGQVTSDEGQNGAGSSPGHVSPTPEKKEAGAGAGAQEPTSARVMRHVFNRHLVMCEVAGDTGLQPVVVRDSADYRAGEVFDVKKNDQGRWQAVQTRIQPRFGRAN